MTETYIDDYTNDFIVHGRTYEVTAPARFDSETDELVDDLELDDKAVEMAQDKYREEMRIVSPDEIKKYQAKIGLSQREFAKVLGWRPNTVALYETGAIPSNSNNKLLKLLMDGDDKLKAIIQQATKNLNEAILRKIEGYLNGNHDGVLVVKYLEPQFTAFQLTNWYRVTNYFDAQKDENNIEDLTQMKVVKLLYFGFGRYAARKYRKFFDSPFIAMPYAPVVEEVHEVYKG